MFSGIANLADKNVLRKILERWPFFLVWRSSFSWHLRRIASVFWFNVLNVICPPKKDSFQQTNYLNIPKITTSHAISSVVPYQGEYDQQDQKQDSLDC